MTVADERADAAEEMKATVAMTATMEPVTPAEPAHTLVTRCARAEFTDRPDQ